MFISDVLKGFQHPVATVRGTATVLEAIQLLVAKGIGSLLVEDDRGEIAGIITERDILKLSASRSQVLGSIKVADVMTRDLITGRADQTVSDVLNIMTRNRIRHVPIMNGGKLAGMVSIGDLVKVQLEDTKVENEQLRDYILQPR